MTVVLNFWALGGLLHSIVIEIADGYMLQPCYCGPVPGIEGSFPGVNHVSCPAWFLRLYLLSTTQCLGFSPQKIFIDSLSAGSRYNANKHYPYLVVAW